MLVRVLQFQRRKQYSGYKAQTTLVTNVGNTRSGRPECQHCGRRHPDECRMNDRACFMCGSQDHFIRDCPRMAKKEKIQNARSGNTTTRGRPPRNTGNASSSEASKSLPLESIEFVIKVSNLLGKHVLVYRVCKNCPLMIRGHYFSTDLMLLPFDEFDVILGMDWLTA
ncbi:Gag-Pol polyprotein [Gossypium australe]|uniref:Gag-Pol polyprotein n=1 Tax=Gossypium australe TaxID=47621 RepID=A0A5B6VC52_9ROSI|nr:Gag-Pol polyprotein [Gossypium australe]